MRAFAVLIIALCFCTPQARSQRGFFPASRLGKVFFEETGDSEYRWRFSRNDTLEVKENPRLVAAVLDLSLGLFGVHRLYLGTDVKVPVFYTLTVGGGAVLWLIDLGLILCTRDLTPYMDNPHVFMWVRDGEPPAGGPHGL